MIRSRKTRDFRRVSIWGNKALVIGKLHKGFPFFGQREGGAPFPLLFFETHKFGQREGRKRDFETSPRIPPRRIGHDTWRGKLSYSMGEVNRRPVFEKKTFFMFKIHTNIVNKVS